MVFFDHLIDSSQLNPEKKTKSADQPVDSESDVLGDFARMDFAGLLDKELSEDDEALSTASDMEEVDDAAESSTNVDTDVDETNPVTTEMNVSQMKSDIDQHGTARVSVRSRIQKAALLRLVVAQELSDVDDANQAQFRTRIYAPLVLEQRAHLQGHLGLVANSLSSTITTQSDTDCECILASVAKPSNRIDQNNTVGCDIRLWQVPPYGTPKQGMSLYNCMFPSVLLCQFIF